MICTVPTSATPNATLFVQNNQIQLHANGGTYGLALLEDGSLIATPQTALERVISIECWDRNGN